MYHSARLRLYWYNGQYLQVRTCTLLAGNDTVPISIWRGVDVHSIDYPVVLLLQLSSGPSLHSVGAG